MINEPRGPQSEEDKPANLEKKEDKEDSRILEATSFRNLYKILREMRQIEGRDGKMWDAEVIISTIERYYERASKDIFPGPLEQYGNDDLIKIVSELHEDKSKYN